jgi:hypothetical protein
MNKNEFFKAKPRFDQYSQANQNFPAYITIPEHAPGLSTGIADRGHTEFFILHAGGLSVIGANHS